MAMTVCGFSPVKVFLRANLTDFAQSRPSAGFLFETVEKVAIF